MLLQWKENMSSELKNRQFQYGGSRAELSIEPVGWQPIASEETLRGSVELHMQIILVWETLNRDQQILLLQDLGVEESEWNQRTTRRWRGGHKMRMILCKMLVGISLISYTPLLHILVHTRSPMHHLTLPKITNEQNQNLCLRGKKSIKVSCRT